MYVVKSRGGEEHRWLAGLQGCERGISIQKNGNGMG